MYDNKKLVSNPNLQLRDEGGDRFIICSNEKGFETNAVGVRIIELCNSGMCFSDLVTTLVREFDAPEDAINEDLTVLIPEMIDGQILSAVEV